MREISIWEMLGVDMGGLLAAIGEKLAPVCQAAASCAETVTMVLQLLGGFGISEGGSASCEEF